MITKNIDKTRTLNIVYDFFNQFHTWFGSSAVTPSVNEIEKYLSKSIQIYNNGQLIVKSSAEYLDRLQKFQKKFSNFKISAPIEEPLISDNQIAIYYQLELTTLDGEHKQICDMGLFTIEDNKISRWVTVTHEKDVENWDT